MYGWVLVLHSWNRWLVLGSALASLIWAVRVALTGAEWTRREQLLARAFIAFLDLQLVLGLSLYLRYVCRVACDLLAGTLSSQI
jgi:hypothetical protein